MFLWIQKSGETVNCAGVDCHATETEGCSEGSVQEQEATAA